MSALNATIYSSSRVSFAMGRDRNLPSWFGRVHPKRKTPHWAIAGSAVLIAFMAVALPIEAVASASDIMFLLLFTQVLVVVWRLRKKRPDLDRGFRVPWVPLVPIVGILLQTVLAVYLFIYSPRAWISALVWIAAGMVVFYTYAQKRDKAYARVVAVREATERKEYRILACIADPRGAPAILGSADALARRFNGEIVGLSVVEVSDGEALPRGLDHVPEIQNILEGVLDRFLTNETPRRALVKVSHRVSFAITETALEEQCNMIILGRARRVGFLDRTLLDRRRPGRPFGTGAGDAHQRGEVARQDREHPGPLRPEPPRRTCGRPRRILRTGIRCEAQSRPGHPRYDEVAPTWRRHGTL